MLEEGICDHRHERMTVKALPGSSLEVIETEFFFQLLWSITLPAVIGRRLQAGTYRHRKVTRKNRTE